MALPHWAQIFRTPYRRLLFASFRYTRAYDKFADMFGYSERERLMKQIMDFVANGRMPGDYLEFGVFRGGTFAPAYHFASRRALPHMRFYAFDSFQGLPPSEGVDVDTDGGAHFREGQFKMGIDEFKQTLRSKRVDLSKVEFIPGFFDESLSEETRQRLPIEKAAVIWVDCDLYESTVPVLDFVTDYVQNGTIVSFDDWNCFRGDPDRGEKRAFREWLEKHPDITATEFHRFDWCGAAFILHRA